jgi:hypothetical protein
MVNLSSTEKPKTHDGEKTASLSNVAGKTGYPQIKTEANSQSFTLHKISLKWIKNLNIRPEILKQLQEVVEIHWKI